VPRVPLSRLVLSMADAGTVGGNVCASQRITRRTNGSGGRTRTGDTAIMSRLLFRLSYTAWSGRPLPQWTEPQYGIEP
jgi:hypothetical protein